MLSGGACGLTGDRTPPGAPDGTGERNGSAPGACRGPVVWALAAGETIVWAGMYYSFPALLPSWEQALGWSKTELAGAFTLALALSALFAPLAGRLIDRGWGRSVLALGALLGGLSVMSLARVESLALFYLAWAGVGLAMAGALYEPCFAHVTHLLGAGARRAITTITLVAGFAGTLSFPSAHYLVELGGWEHAVLVLGGGAALLGAPLLAWGAGGGAPGSRPSVRPGAVPAHATGVGTSEGAVARALRTPSFWLLALAFSLIALDHGMVVTHLLPLLDERGVSAGSAVLAASLIGPMQVVGRVAMLSFERRVAVTTVCLLSFLFLFLSAGALYAVVMATSMAFVFALLQGSGYGVTSITRPVVTAELLGRTGFGAISGFQATCYVGASAVAPMAGALLWSLGRYDALILACAVLALVGLASFVVAIRLAPPAAPESH